MGLIKKVLGKKDIAFRTHAAKPCQRQQQQLHVWFFSPSPHTKCIRNYPIKEMDFSLLLQSYAFPFKRCFVFRETELQGGWLNTPPNVWKNNWRNDLEWDNLYRPLVSSPPPSLCLSCMVTFSKKKEDIINLQVCALLSTLSMLCSSPTQGFVFPTPFLLCCEFFTQNRKYWLGYSSAKEM